MTLTPEQRFTREDWQYDVANGDTQLGYEDWLKHQLESEFQKPTSGPWDIFQLADDPATYGTDASKFIVTAHEHQTEVCGPIGNPCDAPILAAASEMLQSLINAVALLSVASLDGKSLYGADVTREARAIIAKATGKEV